MDIFLLQSTTSGDCNWVLCRLINIHLINSKGVPAYNMAPCIECWWAFCSQFEVDDK